VGIRLSDIPDHLRPAALRIPTKPARKARFTGDKSAAKRKRLAVMRGIDTPEFLSGLAGRWLTRWRAHGGPEPMREWPVAAGRRWRFDFAWPNAKVAVEVDGGTFIRGGHSRGKGQQRDAEKMNAATCLGWRVLRFTTDMIEAELGFSTAVEFVKQESA
jgi:uncharacterized protein DUF559